MAMSSRDWEGEGLLLELNWFPVVGGIWSRNFYFSDKGFFFPTILGGRRPGHKPIMWDQPIERVCTAAAGNGNRTSLNDKIGKLY